MPTFDFDVTENAYRYMIDNIQDMPGNEGQAALVDILEKENRDNCYALIRVDIAGSFVDVTPVYDINLQSPHPDAIIEIMAAGEKYFQEYAERAAEIENLIDEAFKQL